MDAESKGPRYLFLDNIKLFFTILVIFWHTMVSYFDIGWWYYKELSPLDPVSNIFFLLVASLGGAFQTSLLGLFFLLGGYFTPNSYDRKGIRSFWIERLIRLGIPLLIYVVIINPVMIYTLSKLGILPWSIDPVLQGTFLDYYSSRFMSWASFIDYLSFGGPMWFLRVLLLFTLCYTIWRQITKLSWVQQRIPKELPIPRFLPLLLLAFGLGFLTFLVRIVLPIDVRPLEIPWGQLIQYLLMFTIGVICIRYRWFEKITKKYVILWSITIIITLIVTEIYLFFAIINEVDLVDFTGGFNIHAFLFAMTDNIISMGIMFVLIKIFYVKFNEQGKIVQKLSKSAFNMYLLHPLVLVVVSLGFASINLIPIVKLAIIFPINLILCYLISHFVIEKIQLCFQ